MGRTAGEKVGHQAKSHGLTGWHRGGILIVAMLCTACTLLLAGEAGAQCSARDVLQDEPRLASAGIRPQVRVKSAADVPAWKTIAVGTFRNSFALINALDAAGCSIGDSAEEILARPAFTLGAAKRNVELFAVSAAALGFRSGTASLGEIYARAQQLGFGLAAAEIGPQLRLQYLDQPLSDSLIIGMAPIRTWNGEPVILTVANGGAGLILIGQDGSAEAQIPVASRFLFVRPDQTAPAEMPEQAAAIVRR